jgi:hypothetical protein
MHFLVGKRNFIRKECKDNEIYLKLFFRSGLPIGFDSKSFIKL